MADTGATTAASEVYTRPEGMTDKQEQIIQYVAKYVVASCDSAKYQLTLKLQTKYNSYFGFLDVKHPYHGHYEYLLQSYRYWMEQAKAAEQQSQYLSGGEEGLVAVGGAGVAGDYDHYGSSDQNQYYYQQQQQTSIYANAPYQQQQQQQQQGYQSYNYGADPTAAPSGYEQSQYQQQRPGEEEEGEEEYEMVMQNGAQTLVPKRRQA